MTEKNGMSPEENEVVVLIGDDGEETEMELVEIFELDEQKYAVLAPLDEDSDEGFVLKYSETDGEILLTEIEDEEEWEKITAALDESESE